MKEAFKYTFLSITEWKKFLIVILIVSILTLIEAFPVVSIIAFLFHFIPSASGILLALIIIGVFWFIFFVLILQFTGSMFVLINPYNENPHNLLKALATTTFITKILIGFYLIYIMFYGYIFLGKLGEALNKETFKEAFIAMLSSLFDFKSWVKTFNLKYFIISTVWSIIITIVYTIISFVYIFDIFPTIQTHPNISLIIIPIFVAITTIITYFTFFSAYFSYKTMD